MKTVRFAMAALCAAVLFGTSPPRALAGDPAPDSAAPAPEAAGAPARHENLQPASPAQTYPAGQNASGAQNAAGQTPSTGPNHSGAAALAHGTSRAHSGARRRPLGPVPADRPLDLSTPPVNHVMTPEQVQALTEQPDEDETEEVMVEQGRYQSPVPRGQIRALAWALMHPLEAWRIFTPVTDE